MNQFLRHLWQANLAFALALSPILFLAGSAAALDTVYENSSTTLGAGSIPIFTAGSTTVNPLYQEVGDVVTLDPTFPNFRQLDSLQFGYFTQDVPNDGTDDDRFIADFIFRIYNVDGAGDVIEGHIFEKTVEDFVWFDGSFSQTILFDAEVGETLVLPETFAYTIAAGDRVDDPDTPGDGLQTNFSFNSRGPVTIGSSPDGLLRRNNGTFETIVFGSGRQTRMLLVAGDVTIDPGLLGDYNGDMTVDIEDYTLWRDNLNATDESAFAAGSGNGGGIDISDYLVWKNAFGNTAGAGSLVSNTPEPTSCLLLLTALLGVSRRRR